MDFLPVFEEVGQFFLDAAVGVLGDLDLFEVEVFQDEYQLQLLFFDLYLLKQTSSFLEVGLDLLVLLAGPLLDGSHHHLHLVRLLLGLDHLSVKDYLSLFLALLLGKHFSQLFTVEGNFLFGFWLSLGQPFDAVLNVAQHIAVVVDVLGQLEVGIDDSLQPLHLLLPSHFGHGLYGEGVLLVDLLLEGLHFALDVVFEGYLCQSFF